MSGSIVNKKGAKDMTPAQEDAFEERIEGSNFGTLGDWESELAEKILKTENLLDKNSKANAAYQNSPARNLLQRKLVLYNQALLFLENSPKNAAILGDQGGLDAIVSYLEKKAVTKAAEEEVNPYVERIKAQLPGKRLDQYVRAGGFIASHAEQAPRSVNDQASVFRQALQSFSQ